jgi:hypothetical protein
MGYPLYQPQYPQMMPQAMGIQTPQYNSNNLTWVTGIGGAKSYLVAPNSTATLWDSERQTIYLKSADASGMPSMKILDYTIRDDGANSGNIPPVVNEPNNNTEYVLKSDFDALKAEIDGLREEIKHVPRQVQKQPQHKGGNKL